jgi:hypothetical protein
MACRIAALLAGVAAAACGPSRPATGAVAGLPAAGDPDVGASSSPVAAPVLPVAAACPRRLEGLDDIPGLQPAMEAQLRAHYGVPEDTALVYDGETLRGVELADGEVLLAFAFGTDRFAIWVEQMKRAGEWEGLRAQATAALAECRRRNYDECAGGTVGEERAEQCGYLLQGGDEPDESEGCEIWEGLGPPRGPGCCICDTLVAAAFSARLAEDGSVDLGGLRLLGEGTVLERRCNPGLGIGTFELADLDADGRIELFFEQGRDEHDFEEYAADPYSVVVLRDDLTVQQRWDYPGISVYSHEHDVLRGRWYRFEDRSDDGRPDLVVETFELAYAGCSQRRSWFPIVLGPGGEHLDNPSYVSVDEYEYEYEYDPCAVEYTEACAAEAAIRNAPIDCIGGTRRHGGWHGAPLVEPPTLWDDTPGCERGNLERRVLAYDPTRDEWLAPPP